MAAVGYKCFHIDGFPDIRIEEPLQTATQLVLPDWGDDTLHSVVRLLGRSEHPEFEKFHVEHETLRALEVRFENTRRDQVIAIVHFNMFRFSSGGQFWLGTKKPYALELFANIERTEPSIRVRARSVDLAALRQSVMAVSGGWFKDLLIQGVRAAGIFGPGVGENDEWERYEQAGDLSAVTLDFTYRGQHQSATVTTDGGIVVYATFTERERLEFLQEVNKAVEPFATLLKPMSLTRWRKS
jgi:hypothetical protein